MNQITRIAKGRGLRTALTVVLLTIAPALGLASQAGETAGSASSVTAPKAPPYQELKGARLGMAAEEIHGLLGKPTEKDETVEYFEFSDVERARVYYGVDGKAEAIVATYIGSTSAAPTPEAVLGSSIEFAPDGSGSRRVDYPALGYWVAYSRTAGEKPYTIITMKTL
jgi:hypothetical protein